MPSGWKMAPKSNQKTFGENKFEKK